MSVVLVILVVDVIAVIQVMDVMEGTTGIPVIHVEVTPGIHHQVVALITCRIYASGYHVAVHMAVFCVANQNIFPVRVLIVVMLLMVVPNHLLLIAVMPVVEVVVA